MGSDAVSVSVIHAGSSNRLPPGSSKVSMFSISPFCGRTSCNAIGVELARAAGGRAAARSSCSRNRVTARTCCSKRRRSVSRPHSSPIEKTKVLRATSTSATSAIASRISSSVNQPAREAVDLVGERVIGAAVVDERAQLQLRFAQSLAQHVDLALDERHG